MATTVEVGFELTVGDTPYFRLNDPVKGKLDNVSYRLAGPIWIDISDAVSSVGIKRGKNRELDRYSAASASVSLHNENRYFDPLNEDSPYVGNIIPRRSIRISTSGYTQFTGVIEDWNLTYDVSGKSNALIQAADAFTLLAQQTLTPGTATQQTTGERVNAVLSQPTVAWPLAQRNIDTGSSVVGTDVFDGNVLSYLQLVEASEQGQLFMAKNGDVRFVNGSVTPTSGTLTTVRTNWLRNPSFETNTTSWYTGSGNATNVRDNSKAYSGSYSWKTTVTSTTGNATLASHYQAANSDASPVGPTSASIYVWGAVGATYQARLRETTTSGSIVANGTTINIVGIGQWQKVTLPTITKGQADTRVQILLIFTTLGDFWIDAGIIEATATVGEFFDGSTTDTIREIYSWTGTANASTSIEQNPTYTFFSDENDGIPYTSATVNYGTELLFNQVEASSAAGTAISNNTESQTKYGITQASVNTLLAVYSSVESLSQYWVNKYGEPEYRFENLTVNLQGLSSDDQISVLGLELGDIIQIKFTPNGVGSPIQRYGQIINIDHVIGIDRHDITFGVGSLQYSFLVLNDAGFGILDTNALAF